jgi:hypothetical protein
MKVPVTFLLLLTGVVAAGLAAPAAANDYTLENRPSVVFPGPSGGIVHQTPYPQGARSASIWAHDACRRDCTASCTWRMASCTQSAGADACRPHLNACDRTCQRSCRSIWSGPVLGFVDW